MNIITFVIVFNPDSFEEESFKQFILDNFKVGLSSYLLLKLKFKDNRMPKFWQGVKFSNKYSYNVFLLYNKNV